MNNLILPTMTIDQMKAIDNILSIVMIVGFLYDGEKCFLIHTSNPVTGPRIIIMDSTGKTSTWKPE